MWKHKESKWLVKGGRKVRCYLCGKKILAKGDLFLFHGDTGYYSHQSCQAESTTISGNERRRAVKKIAVGAAVVGAIAAGAGKFLDVSSQSKNSPAAQTILTSQGLIPPALTSDPSNPVPGQMWYRSDAGVEAHFDAIENRVIYSNRIVNGSAVVTSKGIVNGLSVLLNDGQDWGPDTTKGATAPGQYGSPYTQTSGIQEAINALPKIYNTNTNRYVPAGKIYTKSGQYVITQPILVYEDWSVVIEGEIGPSGGILGSQYGVNIIGANDIGVLFVLTTDIALPGGVSGGQIYLKNLALLDNYTDASGVYHQYNYSTGYTDLKGHVIQYLLFSCYSTPDTITLDHTYIIADIANTSDLNSAGFIYTNTSETIVQFKGEITIVGATAKHPALTLSSYHFIADTIDIGTNNAPSTYTQYYPRFPTFFWSVGPRNFIATIHFGNNDIFPMWSATATAFIGTIFFELNQPVLGSNGQPPICGNVTDALDNITFGYANFNVASGAQLIVGVWTSTQWNPLKSGFIPGPLTGTLGLDSSAPYLIILDSLISNFGTPFNSNAGSNTGWSSQSASSPTTGSVNYGGIKLPDGIYPKNLSLTSIPSVPASGTAQENTNPFPIDAYIYGGTVTEIQITRNGTAYTVFSNSTGSALSGQSYKLNPGDSITVTYTTAPTWEWLSD